MNNEEFSNSFDTLLNSYNVSGEFGEPVSKQSLVFDEYEKSLFLTKSQEEIAESLYNGRNPFAESFEQTEELRRYLSNLICDVTLQPSSGNYKGIGGYTSKFFEFPSTPKLWFITFESVTLESEDTCLNGKILDVVPVTQDEYLRIKRNPFRGCNSRRALRLDVSDNVIEVVSKYNVAQYYARYLRHPNPIILRSLPNGLSIDGESDYMECELHEALHQKILDRAVILALQSRGALNSKDSK
jgi:hypothetical protein